MIEDLINLALNLASKIHQKSTSEAPKIHCRGHREQDASWHGIWNPLGTDFGGFYGQVGRQVGTKLAYLGGLILSYLTLSYLILPYLILSYLTLVILDILATTVLPSAEVWGQQVSLGNTSQVAFPVQFSIEF